MVRAGKERKKAAPYISVHVEGKPYNTLTPKQKAAVVALGVTEVQWNTRTWAVQEDYSKLVAAQVRATDVLGFNRVSWNAFADVWFAKSTPSTPPVRRT